MGKRRWNTGLYAPRLRSKTWKSQTSVKFDNGFYNTVHMYKMPVVGLSTRLVLAFDEKREVFVLGLLYLCHTRRSLPVITEYIGYIASLFRIIKRPNLHYITKGLPRGLHFWCMIILSAAAAAALRVYESYTVLPPITRSRGCKIRSSIPILIYSTGFLFQRLSRKSF